MTSRPKSSQRMPVALPVILSGFVCPGLGQFVQARRRAGCVFLGLSALAIGWFLGEVVPVIQTVHGLAFDDMSNTAAENPAYSLTRMGVALGLAFVVWLANIFDVYYAVLRQRHSSAPQPPPLPDSSEGG